MAHAKQITNDASKAGQKAGRTEFFGECSRYAIYPVHTRFDAVQWFVADAEQIDPATRMPAIIRQTSTRDEALTGLQN